MTVSEINAEIGDYGVCGFCGTGGGHLGEQGDENSCFLHSAIKIGEREFKTHPGALKSDSQRIMWCGQCESGLAHKYSRYDNLNLQGLVASIKARFEVDPMRWGRWEGNKDAPVDDPSVHLRKLWDRKELYNLEEELKRREQL